MEASLFFVEDCTRLSPTVRCLRLRPKDGFVYRAGQYVEIGFPTPQDGPPLEFFPFSLASAPTDPFLELCIRAAEGHVLVPPLDALIPGAPLWVRGPSGRFFYASQASRPIVWIATGTGIAPLRSLFRSTEHQEAKHTKDILMLGVRNEDEILYRAEWEEAMDGRFFPILSQAPDGWEGHRGRVTEFLLSHPSLLSWREYDYYLCGQAEMLSVIKAFLFEQGVREESLHHERW